MKKENIKVKSKQDGLILDTEIFIPEGNIEGIIQLSHGMVECKEYYYPFMEHLTKHGYVTAINDHRGHGQSVKEKEDLGFFYEESSDYVVEDLHQITKLLKERFEGKKVILFGHSMGSLIVRKYLKKYDDEIDKLIVCGSPSINKMTKTGLFIAKLAKLLKGERYRSKFLNKLTLPKDKNLSWLAYNEKYIKEYIKDKRCGYIFTTNGFINLLNLMKDVYSKKNWQLKNKNLKIAFIAGKDDKVIKSEKKWIKSMKFLDKIGYKNIQYKLYPEMKHAILMETKNYKVYKDILKFIKD